MAFARRWAVAGRLLLLLFILLAFACQTCRLGGQSLWYDEAVTARVASQGPVELTRWTADDIQPPLYYYLVAGWTRAAGRGEWALRFPSVFFGVLLVPLLWIMARRLFGHGRLGDIAAGLAALLAALSPLYTYYAQEARMYTQLTALGLLAGYALLRATAPARSALIQSRTGEARLRPPRRTSEDELRPYDQAYSLVAGGASAGWWPVFVVAAAAALYTHYFAAFLLAAYAIYFLGGCGVAARRRGRRAVWRILRPGLSAAGGVFILYLPWLPAMLNRLQVDRSYWQGALKLDEALRHVAISFTVAAPETMLESDALRWLPWFGAAFAVCLVILIAVGTGRGPNDGDRPSSLTTSSEMQPWAVAFLLLTLAVPIFGVLALASRTPKFNPRYLMLASPAYVLILAGGLAYLLSVVARRPGSVGANAHGPQASQRAVFAPTDKRGAPAGAPAAAAARSPWTAWLSRLLGAAILLLVLAVPAGAQWQWLTGAPGFAKAQWRELAAAVRRDIAPGEAVILVSGHAAPAWDYYAPDILPVRLPNIDVLDVQAVLGFSTGDTLRAALAGKTGAWVVFWQNEAVDPVDFTTYYLDRAGTEAPVPHQFWQLRLRHWRLRPDAAYPDRPQPEHAAGVDQANFSHKLALLGWDGPRGGQLTLYWQAPNTVGPHDYQVSLHFEDAAGRAVAPSWDGRPATYAYPTDRWLPGRPLFGRYPLPTLPPGSYYVTVAVYDATAPSGLDIMDIADNPAGKRVRLGPLVLP